MIKSTGSHQLVLMLPRGLPSFSQDLFGCSARVLVDYCLLSLVGVQVELPSLPTRCIIVISLFNRMFYLFSISRGRFSLLLNQEFDRYLLVMHKCMYPSLKPHIHPSMPLFLPHSWKYSVVGSK